MFRHSSDPVPGPTVDIRLTPVPDADDPSVLDAVRGRLDDWEEERLQRLRRTEDQVRYAAAHALVRVALSAVSGIRVGEWHLATAADGKPYVRAPTTGRELHFSLSHTPGLVGCAVTAGIPVGFDVEALDRSLRVDALARHTLAPSELASRPGAPASGARWFLRFWTLKEALLKATGTGLRISPTEVELAPGDTGPAKIVSLPPPFGDAAAWSAFTLDAPHSWGPAATHLAAVAVRADANVEVRPRVIGLQELLETFGR